jgi:four helix bundle protein
VNRFFIVRSLLLGPDSKPKRYSEPGGRHTNRPDFVRDLKLPSQTEDAVNSICRNISEGFGCDHAEFARFLRISRRSMNELQDAFRAAELKRDVSAGDLTASRRLMRRL